MAHRERIVGLEPGQPEFRVLIVEDQLENWMLFERLLQNASFLVRVAEDGRQGVEMFQAWRPHFIWMDLRLPVMDGLQAARCIRELDGGTEVKIVALTAFTFTSERERVIAAGMDDLVRKPYRPVEIFDCLARHLGVRYVYDDPVSEVISEPSALRPPELQGLAEDLRAELKEAVIALDGKRIAKIIDRINERDAALGVLLTRYADGFAYTAILNAVKDGVETSQ